MATVSPTVCWTCIAWLVAAAAIAAEPADVSRLVRTYCVDCHAQEKPQGKLNLQALVTQDIAKNAATWESVIRKLANRQMPPPDADQPSAAEHTTLLRGLETILDDAYARAPNPGRTETFRRLSRTEYQNAIRDLLALEIDAAALLPADELSHGFDNITVADLSPTLLNRYLTAAQKISRLAVAAAQPTIRGETVRVKPDITQDVHLDGLPLGTRGGTLVKHHFSVAGEYEIQVHLMRDRNEGIEGLRGIHELDVLLDSERVGQFTIRPPGKGQSEQDVDANLKVQIQANAGPHELAVTFAKKSSALQETTRQPLNVHFNFYRHPRLGPAIYEVSIVGPFQAGAAGETPSRRQIFITRPKDKEDESACAERILANLARRAYRRPVTDDDLKPLLEFFEQGRAEGGFETGIEQALASLLVKPQFLFRIERDPPAATSGEVYRLSDLELASRLSFFLWSSIPDDELLAVAERGELHDKAVLEQQVRRMLADDRAESLVTNFAAQWLYLRNLDAIVPDMRLFPDFDDNLRQAMRRETELAFAEMLRDDASVLTLIDAKHAWLNERLAKHYGVPHVYGSRFRRVELPDETPRGGLLRQGSILTVTSYATRTSPVIRGHWILQNLLGAAPPPPPPDVPALDDNRVSAALPIRERLQQHRANAACASCHQQMDPIGFALENFDAVGRFRTVETGLPVDAQGSWLDGGEFVGVNGLEKAVLDRPELFVRTLTEKLLTFGLGRGVEPDDAPAVRQIVREAKVNDYRFSELILGIVHSPPFQLRKAP